MVLCLGDRRVAIQSRDGLDRQRGRTSMLEGAVREGNLAPEAIPPVRSLPESQNVRIAAEIVPGTATDFTKADRTHSAQSAGAVARQAVPPRWEPSDGSISVSLATLERVGTTSGTQAIEYASSESDKKQRRRRPHESADQVSNESQLLLERWRTMAKRGDRDAQFNLGCAYLIGWSVGRDATTAAAWFEAAAEGGDAKAQFNLGVIHAAGNGVEKNLQSASRWFKMAAEQGYTEAEFNLGSMFENGEEIGQDMSESVKWYQRAAQNGHPKAQFNLAVILTAGGAEREKNLHKAISLFEQAFANGVPEAAHNLGVLYDKELGVQCSSKRAIEWYTKAAEQGVAIAQHNLAVCICADMNSKESQALAFKWFHAAAVQGIMLSQHNLAVFYDTGLGVNREADKAMAIHWYKSAANQGFAHSQYLLGAKYATGEGVDEDSVKAFVWIRYAAEQGHADSQCLLASMYYEGRGVFVDYPEAYKWVTLGLNNRTSNVNRCVDLRDDIGQKLHQGQLKRSEQSVTDWSPKSWDHLKPSGYSIKPNNNDGESTYRIIGPIKFVNKLLDMWEIDPNSAVSLLGFDKQNKCYVAKLLRGDEYLVEGSETEDRIAYLFYIWSVLSEWFRDSAVESQWLRTAEQELDGKVPMDLILSGSITDLLLVKEFIDFASGRLGVC